MHRPLDPRKCNIHIDANALDRNGSERDAMVERFLDLRQAGMLSVVVPNGVHIEAQRPQTPTAVKAAILPQIRTLPVERTAPERERYRRLLTLVQGNAKPGRHEADTDHLFEAAKYGGGYFITHDERLLKRRQKIQELLGPQLHVVTLAEFFEIYDEASARMMDTNSVTAASLVDMRSPSSVRKGQAVTAIEKCLAISAGTPRELDHWERECLNEAIDALSIGWYDLALTAADLARGPPEKRSPQHPPLPKAIYDRCTIALLRERLREAAAQPLRV